jgi:hypothetical protein
MGQLHENQPDQPVVEVENAGWRHFVANCQNP